VLSTFDWRLSTCSSRVAECLFQGLPQSLKARLDAKSLAGFLNFRAVAHDVLGILQLVAGENADNVRVPGNFSGTH
jgi:hypothetical protein